MEKDSVGYQTQLTAFKESVGWVENLLEELKKAKAELQQEKLDRQADAIARTHLQHKVSELEWQVDKQNCPFVVVLIDGDADCYIFNGRFLRHGEEGGRQACDALHLAMQSFVRAELGLDDIVIHAKVFANISGLGGALHRQGLLGNASELGAFVTGFNTRKGLFDFVDIGMGKERADHKIRDNVNAYAKNPQCKRVVVACGYDTGYEPFLGRLAGDADIKQRITLLKGERPFPLPINALGFDSAKFDGLFRDGPASQSHRTTARPNWPQGGQASVNGNKNLPGGVGINKSALTDRLRVDIVDGIRVDAKLEINPVAQRQVKAARLCFDYYLKGKCHLPHCNSNHGYRELTAEEFDALYYVARGLCGNHKVKSGDVCMDRLCLQRHVVK